MNINRSPFELTYVLSPNHATLCDLQKLDQEFGKLLEPKDSLSYLRCQRMKICIDSKINLFRMVECRDMVISLNSVVSGIEICNCIDIVVSIDSYASDFYSIPINIVITNSNVEINIPDNYRQYVSSVKSNIRFVVPGTCKI